MNAAALARAVEEQHVPSPLQRLEPALHPHVDHRAVAAVVHHEGPASTVAAADQVAGEGRALVRDLDRLRRPGAGVEEGVPRRAVPLPELVEAGHTLLRAHLHVGGVAGGLVVLGRAEVGRGRATTVAGGEPGGRLGLQPLGRRGPGRHPLGAVAVLHPVDGRQDLADVGAPVVGRTEGDAREEVERVVLEEGLHVGACTPAIDGPARAGPCSSYRTRGRRGGARTRRPLRERRG